MKFFAIVLSCMQFTYKIFTGYQTIIKFIFKQEIMSECDIMALSEFILLTSLFFIIIIAFPFCTDTKIFLIIMKMFAHEV